MKAVKALICTSLFGGIFLAIITNILIIIILGASPADAQVMPHTVGDGTAFIYSPGRAESYGLTSGNVGSGDMGQPMYSRNTRWGNSTGIGTSGLQTQSATADSTALVLSPARSSVNSIGLARPNLGQPFSAVVSSPAFAGFAADRAAGFGGSGMFTGNGLTSAYATSGFSGGGGSINTSIYADPEATPSFNRRGSTMLPMVGPDDSKLFKNIQTNF